MTFFSLHPLLHGRIRHILPRTTSSAICGECNSPNSAPFSPHFDKKMPGKKFFRRPGVHLHPLAPCTPWLRQCTPASVSRLITSSVSAQQLQLIPSSLNNTTKHTRRESRDYWKHGTTASRWPKLLLRFPISLGLRG